MATEFDALGVPAETAVGPSAASPQPKTASGLSAPVPNAPPHEPTHVFGVFDCNPESSDLLGIYATREDAIRKADAFTAAENSQYEDWNRDKAMVFELWTPSDEPGRYERGCDLFEVYVCEIPVETFPP